MEACCCHKTEVMQRPSIVYYIYTVVDKLGTDKARKTVHTLDLIINYGKVYDLKNIWRHRIFEQQFVDIALHQPMKYAEASG